MKLYDVISEMANILDFLDVVATEGQEAAEQAYPQYEGLTEDRLFMALEDLGLLREEKIENIVFALKNTMAEAEVMKVEKIRLARRQQVLENRVESLKKFLALHTDHQLFTCPRSGLRVQWRRSEVTVPDDMEKIPEQYKKTKVEILPDRQAIRRALKAGEDVPGAHLEENFSCIIK